MNRAVARAVTLIAIAGLIALGVWQLERLAWKRALIADVAARLAAAPVPPPAAAGPDDAYTRVAMRGRFVAGRDTVVQAVTALGGGFWVMTPFDTGGMRVLVNRGFVPAAMRTAPLPPPAGARMVTGLLRPTEPDGGFLRANDPVAGRWYSRDVAAIARARDLGRVAPYFVDAARGEGEWPRAGLTVVRFSDNHLAYALTWFAMAALLAWLAWRAGGRGAA